MRHLEFVDQIINARSTLMGTNLATDDDPGYRLGNGDSAAFQEDQENPLENQAAQRQLKWATISNLYEAIKDLLFNKN